MVYSVHKRSVATSIIVLPALLLAFGFVAFWPGSALASPKNGPKVESVATSPAATPPTTILTDFFAALEQMDRGDFAVAATQFGELRQRSRSAGYQNLTELSLQLLSRAEQSMSDGKGDQAAFLARWAEELSPRDARVQLALAEFPAAFDGRGLLSRLGTVVSQLPHHPFLSVALAGTLLLVLLVAGTLGSLLVTIVQLLRHGDSILEGLGKIFPYPWRGFGSICLFLFLLIAPLAGGLLFAVTSWGLVLTRYVSGCRQFSLYVGLLGLIWGLAIPILGAARMTLDSDLIQSMEQLHNDAYAPRAASRLSEPQKRGQNEPVVSFLLGVSQYREGNLKAAQTSFTQAAEAPTGGLRQAAQVNLGATALRSGDANAAKDALARAESDGVTSFELYYNLSQAHLQLLDTEAARRYSALALASDRSRLTGLEAETPAGESTTHPPQLQRAPTLALLPMVLKTSLLGAEPVLTLQRSDARIARLSGLLLVTGKTETIVLLGLLSMALGWFAGTRAKPSTAEREVERTASPSLVWFLIPGGGFVAAERPLIGMAVLTGVIGFVLVAFGAPVRPLPGIPTTPSIAPAMLLAAGMLILMSSVIAAMKTRGGVVDRGN